MQRRWLPQEAYYGTPDSILNTVFLQALLLRQFSFSLSGTAKHWFFTLPRDSIADWDTVETPFYTFYFLIKEKIKRWDFGVKGANLQILFFCFGTHLQFLTIREILKKNWLKSK